MDFTKAHGVRVIKRSMAISNGTKTYARDQRADTDCRCCRYLVKVETPKKHVNTNAALNIN